MKNILIIFSLLFSWRVFANLIEVKGIVKEMGSRRLLSDVKIFFLPEKVVTKTNSKGEFSIFLKEGVNWRAIVNLSGYKKFEESLEVREGRVFNIYLEKIEYNLFETTIVAKGDKRDPTRKSLTYTDFYSTPGAGGDPVKAVSNLPGINRSTQGARVVIQGGTPDDTQYGVNQQYVPIVFHFGGLTSVIMPEAIESVDYLSAGYGPEYGKAIGGIINLNTRSPRTDRFYGIGFLDILNGGLLVEGPLSEKSSFLISARKSWVGEVLEKIAEESEGFDFTLAPSYTDATLVYEYNKSKRKKYSITGLYSKDELKFVLDMPIGNDPSTRGDFNNKTGFHRIIGRFDYENDKNEKYFTSLAVGGDQIFFKINDQFLDVDSENYTFRAEYQTKKNSWTHYFGIDWSYEDYDVGVNLPFFDSDNGGVNNPFSIGGTRQGRRQGEWFELGFYSRNNYQYNQQGNWVLTPAIRMDYYSSTEEGESIFDKILWQPRFSMKYLYNNFEFVRLSLGYYNQLPEEREVNSLSGNPYLKPLAARHLNLGYENDFRRGETNGLKFYSGLFYKDLDDLVNSSSRIIQRAGNFSSENFSNESSGQIFGGELYLQYKNDAWAVNTSYTAARSYRVDQYGNKQLSEFDQTHNFNIIASYQYERWIFSTRFRYVTGNPRTPVIGSTFDADNDVYVPIRGEFFSERNKDFLQLDIRVDRKFVYRDWILSTYLDIQNITNRANSEGLNYNYDYSESKVTSGAPILPTFGLKAEF